MNTEKEKQHYVPKFYLRNFSYNGNKKQIGVFNTVSQFFIAQGKLKTQAYKPFFYGHDGRMEDILSIVEGKLAPIINQIVSTYTLPKQGTTEYERLLMFIILTQLRNPVISDSIINNREELIKRAQEIVPRDKFVESNVPRMSKEQAIKMALGGIETGLKFCNDLHCKLLVNKTDTPFITSDNPFAKYNQYLENKMWFGGWTGYGTRGLQIFTPLNPELTVVFYDGWTYKIGDRKALAVEITKKDVDQLNLLQLLNCEENVFFNEGISNGYITEIHEKSTHFEKPNKPISHIMGKVDQHGKDIETSKIVMLGSVNPKIGMQLSVCTITKHGKQHVLDNRAVQLRPKALEIYDKERQSRSR